MPSQILSKYGGGVTMPSHEDTGTEGKNDNGLKGRASLLTHV